MQSLKHLDSQIIFYRPESKFTLRSVNCYCDATDIWHFAKNVSCHIDILWKFGYVRDIL